MSAWQFLASLFEADRDDKGRVRVDAPTPMGKKKDQKAAPQRSPQKLQNDLMTYIMRRYGQHAHDQTLEFLAAAHKAKDFGAFKQQMAKHFGDPIINQTIAGMEKGPEQKRGPGRPPKATHVDPAQHAQQAAQTAATAASRPDRAGTQANLPKREPLTLKPGEKPDQAMGTAGQLNPEKQPSLQGGAPWLPKATDLETQPHTIATRLDALRQKLADLGHDPRSEAERAKIQGQIADLGKLNQSGLAQSQKRVDYVTKTYGTKNGDQEAAKLGVPTTKERTVVDDEGKEHIQIWGADRIMRWKDADQNANAPGKKEPGSAKRAVHKPMIRDKQTGEMKVRPGDFVGQRWRPSGMSKKEPVARPDQATGRFQHGSHYVNPTQTGQEVVWNGEDWVLPSAFAAMRAQQRAADKGDE